MQTFESRHTESAVALANAEGARHKVQGRPNAEACKKQGGERGGHNQGGPGFIIFFDL